MAQGQCLCGAVRYEVDGPFGLMLNCHCSMCRKAHGAPFATFVTVPMSAFRWVAGEDSISKYRTGSGGTRSFCGVCGSVTPSLMSEMDLAACPAGNLDGELGIKPQSHWFVGSKAPWYEITDSLPQYEGFPPELGGGLGESRPVVEPKAGVIQGSCLCGEVAFEIEGTPERLMYCHCSRCRRARSAAHGSNLFFKPQQLRWLRGESLVKYYKDPNARFFSTAFCEKCGSGSPRLNFERQVAYVPASWVDITDSIPQFAELPPMPQPAR